MRYSPEIEAKILAQIEEAPDTPIILPEWAHWGGGAPRVYINRRPVRLIKHLYEKVVGEVPSGMFVIQKFGVPRMNVNPLLAQLTDHPSRLAGCKKGHEYTPENTLEGVGHLRCRTCYEARAEWGRPTVGEINRSKTHCPQGHPYGEPGSDGKRRCPECRREQAKEYRLRKKDKAWLALS